MEARLIRAALVVAWLASFGASYRTPNFVVDAPTAELAKEIGDTAETLRRDLAIEWLGTEMPQWAQPCMLTAQVAPNLGAGGATSFIFDRGEVFGWRMTIQGSRERILDSVLPHEVTHTVFATHFRQPLPRWADEGACTTVEHESERLKQQQMLITFLKTGRGISFSKMFRMKEYPPDVMPLYSQGYSLARYLIAQGGKQKFLQFLERGLQDENWVAALNEFYGFDSMLTLQNTWLAWVRQGSPEIDPQQMLAGQPRSPQQPPTSQIQLASASEAQSGASSALYEAPAAAGTAAPLVPVPSAAERAKAAAEQSMAGWKSVGAGQSASQNLAQAEASANQATSVYMTPEVQALQQGAQHVQQMARPQPAQKSQQVILQPQATTPASEAYRDATLPGSGSIYRR